MRVPLAIAMALVLAILSTRPLTPPRPSASGAFGRGGSTIVLVHGLGSRADHWLGVARRLAVRHRVRLVDLPGHGASEMPAPFTLERAARALDGALASEQGPVVLVGHSLGGLVATVETLAHPERVRALVLVETSLRPQVEGPDRAAALQALEHDYPTLLRDAYLAFGRDSAQGMALHAEVAAMDPAVVRPWIRLALTTDLSNAAAGLRVPVLVVLATRSWPDGEPWQDAARALGYGAIPGVRARRVADAGHFVMLDRPAELAGLIESVAHTADPTVIVSR